MPARPLSGRYREQSGLCANRPLGLTIPAGLLATADEVIE